MKTGDFRRPIPRRDHIQGPPNAESALLEYGDYECPACGNAYWEVKKLQRALGDRLCFGFRNFPVSSIHPHAMRAAEAAEASGAQGRFWAMHEMLFENQDSLEDADLVRYAEILELDMPVFLRDMASARHAERIRTDFKEGVRAGVNRTPTFFVNGSRHDGGFNLESLLAAFEQPVA